MCIRLSRGARSIISVSMMLITRDIGWRFFGTRTVFRIIKGKDFAFMWMDERRCIAPALRLWLFDWTNRRGAAERGGLTHKQNAQSRKQKRKSMSKSMSMTCWEPGTYLCY